MNSNLMHEMEFALLQYCNAHYEYLFYHHPQFLKPLQQSLATVIAVSNKIQATGIEPLATSLPSTH